MNKDIEYLTIMPLKRFSYSTLCISLLLFTSSSGLPQNISSSSNTTITVPDTNTTPNETFNTDIFTTEKLEDSTVAASDTTLGTTSSTPTDTITTTTTDPLASLITTVDSTTRAFKTSTDSEDSSSTQAQSTIDSNNGTTSLTPNKESSLTKQKTTTVFPSLSDTDTQSPGTTLSSATVTEQNNSKATMNEVGSEDHLTSSTSRPNSMLHDLVAHTTFESSPPTISTATAYLSPVTRTTISIKPILTTQGNEETENSTTSIKTIRTDIITTTTSEYTTTTTGIIPELTSTSSTTPSSVEETTSNIDEGSHLGVADRVTTQSTAITKTNEMTIPSVSGVLTQQEEVDGNVKGSIIPTLVKMEEKLNDFQYQIYALCGSFGAVVLFLTALIAVLALSISKLKDQVSSTRHVPYIPDNRTGEQIHAYDNSAFSSGHEMQERRRSNQDKDAPKQGYGVHNGTNPYERSDTKSSRNNRRKLENIPLDTIRQHEAESSQMKKSNSGDRDSKSTLMRYEDGVIPFNNDSTPNGSMRRRAS